MISIDEVKEAITRISDTDIIIDSESEKKKTLKFKKNGDTFFIQILQPNDISNTNFRISRLIYLNKKTKITKDDGELIEKSINLTSESPCKVVYIYDHKDDDLKNSFFITNIYTDKLDNFKLETNPKMRISNIVIIILGMLVEIISCNQEIHVQAVNAASGKLTEDGSDGE